jgi:hypothetical protein
MTQAQIERSTPTAPAPVTNLVPGSMKRRVTWRRVLLLIGPIVLVVVGGVYYLFSGRYVSTDDAYIKSRMLAVTATVPGQVVAVPVSDNQQVKKGDVLVQIDPAPYQLRLRPSWPARSRMPTSCAPKCGRANRIWSWPMPIPTMPSAKPAARRRWSRAARSRAR